MGGGPRRSGTREYDRRQVIARSRSCDASRSRHFDENSDSRHRRVLHQKRGGGNNRSNRFAEKDYSPKNGYAKLAHSPRRRNKRPHRDEDRSSISIQRKQRRVSQVRHSPPRYEARSDRQDRHGRNKLDVRRPSSSLSREGVEWKKYNKTQVKGKHRKSSSCSPPRRHDPHGQGGGGGQGHGGRRKPQPRRRHSESSLLDASSDDGYRSLEVAKPPKIDDDGHLVYKRGDMVQGRYELLFTLGEGAFGRVIKCIDHERREKLIALKVIKNVKKYREEARLEIKVLETIIDRDRRCASGCIFLLDWFDYHGFMCLAFEMLGKSIYDFLKDNNYYPYPMKHIKRIAQQLGKAVKFLHDNEMTHTDLKPENILFVDSSYEVLWNVDKNREEKILRRCDIKLIDFGSTTFDDEHHTKIVQTRHYRAPEVILELGWCQSCDVWSIGCILFELYTGETMFLTHDNHEHLAMMTYILGRLPSAMIKRSRKSKYFYHGRLNWDFDERNEGNKYIKQHCKPLSRSLRHRSLDDEQLMELIWDCLSYDPEKRVPMSQYLKHSYFDTNPASTSSQPPQPHVPRSLREASPNSRSRSKRCKSSSRRKQEEKSNARISRTKSKSPSAAASASPKPHSRAAESATRSRKSSKSSRS